MTPRDSHGALKEIQGEVSVLASAGDEECDEGKEAILDYLAFFRDYSTGIIQWNYPSLVANST